MVTKRTPTLDKDGRVFDKHLPPRLSEAELKAAYANKPAALAEGQTLAWNAAQGKFVAFTDAPKFAFRPYAETIDAPLSTDAPTVTKVALAWTDMTAAGWVRVPYGDVSTPGLLATSTATSATPGAYGRQTVNKIGPLDMPYAVEWVMDGTDAGVPIIRTGSGSSYPRYRIFVDGKPITADVQIWTEAANYNYPYSLKLTWATAATRRIRVEFADAGILGVDKPPTAAIYPPAARRPKAAILGDSWIEGTLEAGDKRLDAMAWLLGRVLNADIYVNGYGGTGYINGNASTPPTNFGATDRMPNLYSLAPDYVIIFGTINDNTTLAADLQAAAAALYAGIAANLPKTKVIVVGSESYNNSSNTNAVNVTNRDAVKAAALAAPNVIGFVDPMSEKWITGTGMAGINRTVTDGVTTASSTTITSATAAFVAGDVGRIVSGAGIPAGASLASVTDGTTAVLSVAATATATAVTVAITNQRGDGPADRFHNGGAVNHLTKAGNRYYAERVAAKVAALTA